MHEMETFMVKIVHGPFSKKKKKIDLDDIVLK